jgi:hypothetical protein
MPKQKRKIPDAMIFSDNDIETTVPAFLWKTYNIVSDPENSNIICWALDGTKFIIKKINEFASEVLPKHFKHSNYASFVRQLNMYDFHKTKHSINEHCFSHPKFQRNNIALLKEIRRKAIERTKGNEVQLDLERGRSSTRQMVKLIYDLQLKHQDLELRLKEIDRINKDYSNRLSVLLNEYIRTKDREQNLEKLMIWAFTSLSPQNPMIKDNRDIKESIDKLVQKSAMGKEMQGWVMKILTDSLKNQGIHNTPGEPYLNSLMTIFPNQAPAGPQMMISNREANPTSPTISQDDEGKEKIISSPMPYDEFMPNRAIKKSSADFTELPSPVPELNDSPFMTLPSPSHSFAASYVMSPYRQSNDAPLSDMEDNKMPMHIEKKESRPEEVIEIKPTDK